MLIHPKADWFWTRVKVGTDTVCWPWQRFVNAGGYGRTTFGGNKILAHRIAWIVANGPIAEGKYVCHTCDNRLCCNPSHLFLGSYADNVHDCIAKGRRAPMPDNRGEKSGNALLTSAQVLAIRADRRPQKAIATEYGVSQTAICNIKTRRRWAHL